MAGLAAIRAVTLSAVHIPAQVWARIRFLVPLPVGRFLRGVSTILVEGDSEASVSGTTAAGTVVVTDTLTSAAESIRTGGGILVPRSTTISNTRRVWRTT
jgi:hypothetical protein